MTEKNFYLAPDDIKPLIEGAGSCLATDRITVDGAPVGFLYRDPPSDDFDSGWRFMAGDESDEYLDDEGNMGVFDVNTIANYDGDILPLIEAPVGAAFERDPETGEFANAVSPVDPDDCLHPDFPVVEGEHALNAAWCIALPWKFNRRIEEGNLVLWRPGTVLYFVAWNNDNGDAIAVRFGLLRDDVPPEAFEIEEVSGDGYAALSYRLVEDGTEGLYGFVVAEEGHLQVAFHVSDGVQMDAARALFETLRPA